MQSVRYVYICLHIVIIYLSFPVAPSWMLEICIKIYTEQLLLNWISEKERIILLFANLYYNRFIESNSLCNYESVSNYLHFETLYSRWKHFDDLYLINVFGNKINWYSIVDSVVVYPLKNLGALPHLTLVTSQDFPIQHSIFLLQTASADLRTFSMNIPSPLRMLFLLSSPTEFMVPVM
jgi:hypothetical protein